MTQLAQQHKPISVNETIDPSDFMVLFSLMLNQKIVKEISGKTQSVPTQRQSQRQPQRSKKKVVIEPKKTTKAVRTDGLGLLLTCKSSSSLTIVIQNRERVSKEKSAFAFHDLTLSFVNALSSSEKWVSQANNWFKCIALLLLEGSFTNWINK